MTSASNNTTHHPRELQKLLNVGFMSMMPLQIYADGLTFQRCPPLNPPMLVLADLHVPICQQQERTGIFSLQQSLVVWAHVVDKGQKVQNGGVIVVNIQRPC
jgi:hypothetical protein